MAHGAERPQSRVGIVLAKNKGRKERSMAPRRSMLRDLTCARFGGFVLVLFGSTSAPGRGNRRLGVVVAMPGSGARVLVVYPRIVSTDVDDLRLLAEWHEVSRKPFSYR